MTDEPTPIAYTCVMWGAVEIKDQMNALGALFGWSGDNFAMQAVVLSDPTVVVEVYGYNDGVSVAWRDMIVNRVFVVPEGSTAAQINGLLDAMGFLFRPIMAGQSGRDVRDGQIAEYLTANGLTALASPDI